MDSKNQDVATFLSASTRRRWRLGGAAICLCAACLGAGASDKKEPAAEVPLIKVPMTAQRWQDNDAWNGEPKATAEFVHMEGFPEGIVKLNGGSIHLKDVNFRDGTIEFDLRPIGDDIPGIRFREQTTATGKNSEEFYLRPSPNCPGSDDCFQYAPVINGFMLWDMFPQYQSTTVVTEIGWNHVKLVVSGRRMSVYVNHSPNPTLTVGKLEADTVDGGIELRGPAAYANMTIAQGVVEGLPPTPTPDPTIADHGIVRRWSVSQFFELPKGKAPQHSEIPTEPADWKNVTAERFGMVNINRLYTSAQRTPLKYIWLKTIVDSDTAQTRRVSLGFARQVWVFVNGKLVTSGLNAYYPEGQRRSPDGRLALENGTFDLALAKGHNDIAIALASPWGQRITYYGWGLEMRFDDMGGVRLAGQ